MAEHIIKRFDEELNKLRYRLIKMGSLVQQQVELSSRALTSNNFEFAKLVLELDDKVDKLDIKIDKQCLRIFALHQPVAMDLRLVLSAVSINDNMEMIGDIATNIAHNVLEMNLAPGILSKTKFQEFGTSIELIIANLLDAFIYADVEKAKEVIKKTPEIKKLFKDNFDSIKELLESDNQFVEQSCYLIDTNRNFQFIYDQARSIAQELVFLVEAKLVKHQLIEDAEEQIPNEDIKSEEKTNDNLAES